MPTPRTICYVTGTRAEFGLMARTLRAIASHPGLRLQLVVTGIHLDPAHGRTIRTIRADGWTIDATVRWKPAGDALAALAAETGRATARLAAAFATLDPDVVLVTGDRVEAFAAATAAHLSGRVLAHVHGGDRAQGQVDDSLRHAITKLAHVHLPATRQSAHRIARLGEDKWRIHQVGSPGLDGIADDAWPLDRCARHLIDRRTRLALTGDPEPLKPGKYVVLLYHPTDADDRAEHERAGTLLDATRILPATVRRLIVYPNNDPGSAGIVRQWQSVQNRRYRATKEQLSRQVFIPDLPRGCFLGLLRHAACLIGNSSAGIIEAASFGTPVIDVGPRQAGRERGTNVTTVPLTQAAIRRALRNIWNGGHPRRHPKRNPYGQGDTAARIARTLATLPITPQLRQKLIAY
jgi:UDP-hydrolysing UDP-N-acetyl-D-glucosamine 2-epimerase